MNRLAIAVVLGSTTIRLDIEPDDYPTFGAYRGPVEVVVVDSIAKTPTEN